MDLVFATNNTHKIKEVKKLLPPEIRLLTLKDIDSHDDLPETGNTLSANALQKGRYIYEKFGMDCFADDSGLEVISLGGRPGVLSARFSGVNADANSNNLKLLAEMKGIDDRRAYFVTVIALIRNGDQQLFEGRIAGKIGTIPKGSNGFGYDPLFIPDGQELTFAEMSEEQKNLISHRAIAIGKFVKSLSERYRD
jgi:XTP/dITP diphosphohydrolase